MRWVRQAWLELLGLFVDDGSFAAALIVWVLAAGFLLPLMLTPHWTGPVFFAGVAVILIENVRRSAGRRR